MNARPQMSLAEAVARLLNGPMPSMMPGGVMAVVAVDWARYTEADGQRVLDRGLDVLRYVHGRPVDVDVAMLARWMDGEDVPVFEEYDRHRYVGAAEYALTLPLPGEEAAE